jgi:hypothetical protein
MKVRAYVTTILLVMGPAAVGETPTPPPSRAPDLGAPASSNPDTQEVPGPAVGAKKPNTPSDTEHPYKSDGESIELDAAGAAQPCGTTIDDTCQRTIDDALQVR